MTTSIYTRTGDDGTTGLADGSRIPKHALRIEAYGTVDEANANLGKALAILREQLNVADGAAGKSDLSQSLQKLYAVLTWVSHRLFNCSSILAKGAAVAPEGLDINSGDVENLEHAIDFFQSQTGPLTGFVLCLGTPLSSQLHIARTVVRRAERAIVRMNDAESEGEMVVTFINRCSDLFFAAARYASFCFKSPEIYWQKDAAFPIL